MLYFFKYNDASMQAEGIELSSDTAALQEAVAAASELLCESDKTIWDGEEISITVEDETGREIGKIAFRGMKNAHE